ncbi:MAG: hypothetical protein KC613_23475, partial [Myxococcales bacterium]|nr:hypothetical protein [Myxococcales bacterium]
APPPPPPPPKKSVEELQPGDAVRLTRGLLAGKEGVIRGADKKGYLKIKVGALEMPIAVTDLEALE